MSATEHEHEFVWSGAQGRCECGANVWVIQEVLDAAAGDARKVAGEAHYTGCRVSNESESVELWLFEAPSRVLQELESTRPGVYVIHNGAPRPYAAVLELMDAIAVDRVTLEGEGINIVGYGPTQDGYLSVEVMGDVPTAQARLDAMYGGNVVRVEYGEPGIAL